MAEIDDKKNPNPNPYIPDDSEIEATKTIFKHFETGRTILYKSYNYFNGRTLYECIDDWTKRWNGYISAANPLLDISQSRIFLNFTRNAIISYLSKVAMQPPKSKIQAVNKKSGLESTKFAEILRDMNAYSLNAENGEARFLETALEATIKGTVIKYEGYAKNEQDMEIPIDFDAENGKIKTKKEKRVIFDNCYQEIVPIEDFYIANPYQPDVQKQPFVIWRKMTSYDEAKAEYGHYKNFKKVKGGNYAVALDPTTFYRNTLLTELGSDQVEILRYYNRTKNRHIILINGVICYDGIIPFKDGMYPFAKGIFEPYGNDFFWGAGFPQKIMGDQDLLNTFWNMMVDKTTSSLIPFGLTSDLDDIVEDEVLAPNKIRKVNDITKWKFDTMPGVTSGEIEMLQLAQKFAQDNSGITMGGASQAKGKMTARQILIQQQEAMSRIGFSNNFLEDFERDRTELRVHHMLQFYSIPKIEKITGKRGKVIEQFLYRDVKVPNTELTGGAKGTKIIKLSDNMDENAKVKMADDLSLLEVQGELSGTPTEALAISVDSFYDYNFMVEVVRNSSYEKNAALDQASRIEFATWRLGLAQQAPVDAPKLVKWVEQAWDIDNEEFEPSPQQVKQQSQDQTGQLQQGGGQQPMLSQLTPSKSMSKLDMAI